MSDEWAAYFYLHTHSLRHCSCVGPTSIHYCRCSQLEKDILFLPYRHFSYDINLQYCLLFTAGRIYDEMRKEAIGRKWVSQSILG